LVKLRPSGEDESHADRPAINAHNGTASQRPKGKRSDIKRQSNDYLWRFFLFQKLLTFSLKK